MKRQGDWVEASTVPERLKDPPDGRGRIAHDPQPLDTLIDELLNPQSFSAAKARTKCTQAGYRLRALAALLLQSEQETAACRESYRRLRLRAPTEGMN